MQAPAGYPEYITGEEAIDVSRMTGIPLKSPRHDLDEPGDIAWDAIPYDFGGSVFIDLGRLEEWDRWRVAWCRIGAYHYLEENPA